MPAPTVVVATSLTVSSTTRRSNHHRNAAIRPPITMNSRWFRSSNHHLFSDARYRNGTRAVSAPDPLGVRAHRIAPRLTPNRRQAASMPITATATLAPIRAPSMPKSWNSASVWRSSSSALVRTPARARLRGGPARSEAQQRSERRARQGEDEAEQDRRDGQEPERSRHDRRRFVDVRLDGRIDPALAPERQPDQPEHVERGHDRDDDRRSPRPTGSRA